MVRYPLTVCLYDMGTPLVRSLRRSFLSSDEEVVAPSYV